MNLAELEKLCVLEAGNQAQHTGLLAITQMVLKTHHAVCVSHQIFLSQLHGGVRLAPRFRIDQANGLHRPISQGVNAATREFGLDRGGVSGLLMLAQLVDLAALLPVGRLADGLGRTPVLGFVIVVLGLGTAAVGLGSFPWFVAGCACFGFGLAGWMLPVGVIREHTRAEHLASRMGLYRVGVDAAMFFGPFASGLLGEENARIFVTAVGGLALVVGGRLLLTPSGRRAAEV